MDELVRKRTRVGREEWAKRVERWRDSGLTTAEFAAELGINPHSLTYWAWTLKREASGQKRIWTKKTGKHSVARKAATPSGTPTAPFVEVKGHTPGAKFELEIRGRRLHIPDSFDAKQLRSLLEILETA
ncbi:MAG: hypothetical protein RL033_6187 [Pseudomonadota bacterium]